jgi:tRNA pseudouridine55 synthase
MIAMKERQGSRAGIGDGVLNIKKPAEWTSHDVVAKLRSLLKVSRIGHGGTLDPAATGVLPIFIGRGTRLAEYVADWDKEYLAVMRLGATTDTQDATGAVLATSRTDHLTHGELEAAVSRFRGRIKQLPPMYSAVKVGGQPLYRAARAGKTVARELREVVVHELELLGVEGRDVSMRIRCSKGTYIRTLCADIGAALGVGAHLFALERTRVGPLRLTEASTLEDAGDLHRLAPRVISMDDVLTHLPAALIEQDAAERATHGVPVPVHAVQWMDPADERAAESSAVRLKDSSGRLLGVGRMQTGGREIAIEKILVDVNEEQRRDDAPQKEQPWR